MQHTVMETALNNDVKKVAQAEEAIEKRLETARARAGQIISDARAQRMEKLEEAERQASAVKAGEVEKIRKEVAAECQEITRQAQDEAAKVQSTASKQTINKLLEEFRQLVAREARK